MREWALRPGADPIYRQGLLMSGSYLFVGVVNYGYQIVMGRILRAEDYGAFCALFSFLYIMGIVEQSIMMGTAWVAARSRENSMKYALYGRIWKQVLIGSILVFGLLLWMNDSIRCFLNLSSWVPVAVTSSNILFSIPLALNFGFLLGAARLNSLAGWWILQSLTKFVCGVCLVKGGLGLTGALGAVSFSSLVCWIGASVSVRSGENPKDYHGTHVDLGQYYKLCLYGILFSFCFAVPTNVDLMIVKSHFSCGESSVYAAAAVLAKAMIFLPFGISNAFFPRVARRPDDPVDAPLLLRKALVYSVCVVGPLVVLYGLWPSEILDLAFGGRYAAASPLVRWFGIAMFLFGINLIILHYYFARVDLRYMTMFAVVTVGEIIWVWMCRETLAHVIFVLMVGNGLVLLIGMLMLVARPALPGR